VTLAGAPLELLVDRYELTMAASYLAEGRADDRVAFELSVREGLKAEGVSTEDAATVLAEFKARRGSDIAG